MKVKNVIYLFSIYLLIFNLIGCDAFVRKFTRKSKKENLPQEEMVLVPEEYKGPQMSKEQLYRQYFEFWKSWHNELIESLLQYRSLKKKVDCTDEAIKNLLSLRALLKEDKQKKLDTYIAKLKDFRDQIADDIYGTNNSFNRDVAEHLKMDILRDFSYHKISKDIV